LPKLFNYILLLIAFNAGTCYAQRITGIVTDKTTNQPVNGALVSLSSQKAFTNNLGEFTITAPGNNDSLKVTHFGYKPYQVILNKALTIVHIELEPAVIALNQVVVYANREDEFKKDSINNRLAYASQFNYTGPKIKDAFTGNANKQPGELISINPLILIAALTKKSTPEYKFHKTLLNDEQAEYVSRKFNRGIVAPITGLKGDTLSAFLIRYRPDYAFAKKATDYDMINYIKDRYKEFAADGFKADNPFK
jgi:hypothetical protein